MLIQVGDDYDGNLPTSCLFVVYEFSVYALVREGGVRLLNHRQITFRHLDSGRRELYIDIATGTLMLPAFVACNESVSFPRSFHVSLLAVSDEVI